MQSMNPRRRFLMQAGMFGIAGTAPALWQTASAQSESGNLKRIVSIGGAITEIVVRLQGEAGIAGVDTTSNFPASLQKLPNVGYARKLSAEGILSLSPQLVIASHEAGPSAVLRQIEGAGIRVQQIPEIRSFKDLLSTVALLGQLLKRPAQAQQLQQQLTQEWAQVQNPAAQPTTKARALFVMAHAPGQVMLAGRDTHAHTIMEYAGLQNAFADVSGYKAINAEALIQSAPDLLIATEQGVKTLGNQSALLSLPGMAQTPAARHQRVVVQEAMLMLGFGPRLPQAVNSLREAAQQQMRKRSN
ncbi:helical backbone metal receptor [Undibacterium luofuense]|uniref:heme/hemin ABC transporter substrate-binding protein n=1 Tax=Undibacterium luofuense TaxID=2828733 RepID=UPI0030ED2A50